MKKNGGKSVSRIYSGVCTIQLKGKTIVESPTYGLAASADLSTTGNERANKPGNRPRTQIRNRACTYAAIIPDFDGGNHF